MLHTAADIFNCSVKSDSDDVTTAPEANFFADNWNNINRSFKVPLYAVFGGGEVLCGGNSNEAWIALGQVWSGPLLSAGPVGLARKTAGPQINQTMALLLNPTLLTHSQPEDAVAAGWSLGCVAVQVLAIWLQTSLSGLRAAVAIDARNRKPFCHLVNPDRKLQKLIALGASQLLPFGLTPIITMEFRSGLLRGDDMQFFLQDDAILEERSDINAGPCEVWDFFESDHYVVGMQQAWDIARRVRC